MSETNLKNKKQIQLEKLEASIKNLQAKKDELLHKRLIQIAHTLKRSKAFHLPDTLIINTLRHVASLYDANPKDPFFEKIVDASNKNSEKESEAS